MKSWRSWTASNSPVASRLTRPIKPSRRCTSSDFFSNDSTGRPRTAPRALPRVTPVSLPQETFGVRDAPLDVAAEPVLVLVGLAETVELGGRLAPRPIDLGLSLGGRALGLGRHVAGVRRGERGVVGVDHRPSACVRAASAVSSSARSWIGSCMASVSRSARTRRGARRARWSRRRVSTATRADTGCCGVRGSSGISSGSGSASPRRSRHAAMPSSRASTRCRRFPLPSADPASSAPMTERRSAAEVMSASAASTCSWRNVTSAPISAAAAPASASGRCGSRPGRGRGP